MNVPPQTPVPLRPRRLIPLDVADAPEADRAGEVHDDRPVTITLAASLEDRVPLQQCVNLVRGARRGEQEPLGELGAQLTQELQLFARLDAVRNG